MWVGIIDCKTYVEEAILGGYKLQRLQYLQFPTIFGVQSQEEGKSENDKWRTITSIYEQMSLNKQTNKQYLTTSIPLLSCYNQAPGSPFLKTLALFE